MSEETFAKLTGFLKGDVNAIKLCIDLMYLGHFWDDLIDKDLVRSDEEINQAFLLSLGDIPMNPFYQAFQIQLAPLMMSASLLWLDSTKLERGDNDSKLTAFCIRNALLNLIHFCMFLVGGVAWVREQGPEFWKTFSLTEDLFQQFLGEA
jgi:hypothetical protein